jgi:predicted nucleotide-binding protein (sugar kinase/HSP70/actin superfamily)
MDIDPVKLDLVAKKNAAKAPLDKEKLAESLVESTKFFLDIVKNPPPMPEVDVGHSVFMDGYRYKTENLPDGKVKLVGPVLTDRKFVSREAQNLISNQVREVEFKIEEEQEVAKKLQETIVSGSSEFTRDEMTEKVQEAYNRIEEYRNRIQRIKDGEFQPDLSYRNKRVTWVLTKQVEEWQEDLAT